MGLAPQIVEEVFTVIERIRDEGTTVLLVEQNAYLGESFGGGKGLEGRSLSDEGDVEVDDADRASGEASDRRPDAPGGSSV